MHTVIAFDVTDDRRRYRVVKFLKALAVRVQKSVFEATDLDDAPFLRLRSELEGIIDLGTDRLRYHRLCAACARRAVHVGNGPLPLDSAEEFVIVGDVSPLPSQTVRFAKNALEDHTPED